MSESVVGKRLLGIDAEHRRFTSRVIPYSVDDVWPHLTQSYLEFQSFLHASQDTASPVRLVPGSPEGVGAIIEFDWNGSSVKEQLVVQDPQRHVWRIVVPGETSVFKRYSATVTFTPMTDVDTARGRTLAALEVDMVLREPSLAPSFLPGVDALILARLPRLEEYVHLKNGYFTLRCSGVVTVPLGQLWSIVSNWNDISWVLGATSVDVDQKDPYFREVHLGGGYSVSERLVAKDDDTHTMTYQIIKGSFPVNDYKATLHLEPSPAGTTAFVYDLLFVPKAGVTAEQAGKQILARLQAGFGFISASLGAKPHP
jgi:hypothetical protein